MEKLIDTLNEKELKDLFENTIQSWQVEKENEQEFIRQTYENAKTYAREEANQENFFMNSIGFWKKTTYHPRRKADYTSFSHSFLTGKTKKSSEYWYTEKGVYRRSNHWGMEVASCSWMLEGRPYSGSGCEVNYSEIGFIEWKDLFPKGFFRKSCIDGSYSYSGFIFA